MSREFEIKWSAETQTIRELKEIHEIMYTLLSHFRAWEEHAAFSLTTAERDERLRQLFSRMTEDIKVENRT